MNRLSRIWKIIWLDVLIVVALVILGAALREVAILLATGA